MDKVLATNGKFTLMQRRKQRHGRFTGKPYYVLTVKQTYDYSFVEAVRDIVDPTRCRAGAQGRNWKYDSRSRAESHYLMLVLKWPQ